MIAVTGATGFLGAHVVCYLLESGYRVRALKRESSSLDEFNYIFTGYFEGKEAQQLQQYMNQLTWVNGDICDIPSLEEAFKGVETIYHCAAIVSFEQKHKDALFKINIEGTANVVNTALSLGVPTLCHVSSIAALGRAVNGASIDEQTKWADSKENSNYAVSKHKAEMEVWRGAEEGLNVVVVNPGVILGIGNWKKGSCKLFDLVWKGMPFYTHGVNGYVDVKDVAAAMVQLVAHKKYGQRYVLAPHNLEMKYFLDETAAKLNKKKPFIKVTPMIARLAVWGAFIKSTLTGQPASITKETARTSLKQYFYNSEKVQREISFSFTQINQTLQYICKSFLAQHS